MTILQPNPCDWYEHFMTRMYFRAGDIVILPSRLLFARVWNHLIMNICSLPRATKSKTDSSMTKNSGVYIYYDGVCLLYVMHVVLLTVCTQFYNVQDLCSVCVLWFILLPTQNSDHLRNIVINNSLRGLRFCFGCYGRAQYLSGVVQQTIIRAFNRYLFRWKTYWMSPPTYRTYDYCRCVAFVFPFNLRHLRDFTSHTSRGGTLYIYI